MAQKRDNAYFEDRLREEHPAIHADFQRGVHRTLAEALIVSGLRKPRSRLLELRNAWDKASQFERDEFLRHIAGLAPIAATSGVPLVGILAHGRLTSPAIAAIERFMHDRKLRMGDVMDLIGRGSLDASMGMALRRNTTIQPEMAADLEALLIAEGYWAAS